jgi:hypothetical protein
MSESVRLNVSLHAFHRLRERDISLEAIESAICPGVVIREYMDERPRASKLLLGFVSGRALHVVAVWDADENAWRVVTAYWPDPHLSDAGFRTRRQG